MILTLIPATGWVGKMTPSAVFVENRIVRNGVSQVFFCDIVTDHLGFPTEQRISLHLLPVLRGRLKLGHFR